MTSWRIRADAVPDRQAESHAIRRARTRGRHGRASPRRNLVVDALTHAMQTLELLVTIASQRMDGFDRERIVVANCGKIASGAVIGIFAQATLGGFAGPYLVGALRQATGTFSAKIWAMAAILGISAALASALPMLVRRD